VHAMALLDRRVAERLCQVTFHAAWRREKHDISLRSRHCSVSRLWS
jgi:hypothetical protein